MIWILISTGPYICNTSQAACFPYILYFLYTAKSGNCKKNERALYPPILFLHWYYLSLLVFLFLSYPFSLTIFFWLQRKKEPGNSTDQREEVSFTLWGFALTCPFQETSEFYQTCFHLVILDKHILRFCFHRVANTYGCCLAAVSWQEDVLSVYPLSDKEIYVLFAAMTVRELWWYKCLQKDEWIGPFREQGCQESREWVWCQLQGNTVWPIN